MKLHQIDSLLDKVEKRQIDVDEALKQINELKSKANRELIPSANPGPGNIRDIVPEVYGYDEPYLKDHTVNDERVLIGVTHGSLAINAFFKIFPQENSVHLHRLNFVKPIVVKKGGCVKVAVELVQNDGAAIDFQVVYRYEPAGTWDITATGTLKKSHFASKHIDIENIKRSLQEYPHQNQIYTANPAVVLGESLKTITRLYQGADQVLARVAISQSSPVDHAYVFHPLIINSVFLAVAPLLSQSGGTDGFLPFGIKDIIYGKTHGLDNCWVLVKLVKNSGEMVVFDADVVNDEFQTVAYLSGCSVKRMRTDGPSPARVHSNPFSAAPGQPSPENSAWTNPDPPERPAELSRKIQTYLVNKLGKIIPDRSRLANLEANLMDLGLESSQLVALAREIEKELNIELNATLFFEYPNIKELMEYFAGEHRTSFTQMPGSTAKQPGAADTAYRHQATEVIPPPAEPGVTQPGYTESPIFTPFQPVVSHPDPRTGPLSDDIAVIGMHGMFAGSADLDQFWDNLVNQQDLMKEIPPDHWDYRPWYDENREAKDKTYCKWGSFIDDVDKFDPGFFNISPREAEWMDPQLRLLLQCIYATGEDAGYINHLRGSNTGVFVGVCFHDYSDKIIELKLPVDPYIATGNSQTVIANRVSFLFDFKGPSIAVNTACSSTLFALHYACHALKHKECDMAFVGGVNLLLASAHYRYFSSIGALSPTGRCHSFDEAADGYAPGECIGSVLLKPLRQAEKDNDHIYAVIKGSAALHGGYTPSLTAPSVAGEENVILKAWENSGINPETLSYIEAHGTGTKLGDPIEINSLKKAFKRFTNEEHFCAVGSAKANIGHAEGAAGIAGLLKVILQMKHKQIPAMPQFKTLNPYIQLEKSALYINRELEAWESPAGVPRRAGISSFGFSGAYAHVVVEEYIPKDPERLPAGINDQNPAIIVLSAKNEERLREQARRLLAAIHDQQLVDTNLASVAYTLQAGREAMEERLVVVAGSAKELEEKLSSFVEGREGVPDLYRGQIKNNRETLAVLTSDEDMAKAVDAWITKRKYPKLLELWVKGLVFDWNQLYGNDKPPRICLPTYPFAKERYWVPESGIGDSGPAADFTMNSMNRPGILHPLLHQNTSDLSEQRFTSSFTGREFFLSDHVVKGQRVLPGVAYLEMARAAVGAATGAAKAEVAGEESTGLRLKNVGWARPVTVGDRPVQVHIGIIPEANGTIAYEIYRELDDQSYPGTSMEPVVYCQGNAVLGTFPKVPKLDLQAIKERCNQKTLSAAECYEAYRALGLDYGPGHRGIDTVYTGQDQLLAKLRLPSSVAGTRDQFILHPSMMDAALQAAIGFTLGVNDPNCDGMLKPSLPFALEELAIYGGCRETMWAVIRHSDGGTMEEMASAEKQTPPNSGIRRLDIDLCDETGNVQVRLKGFSSRVLEGRVSEVGTQWVMGAQMGTLLLHSCWKEQAVDLETIAPEYHQHLVFLGEMGDMNGFGVVQPDNIRCFHLQSNRKGMAERFQAYATQVLVEIQNILKEKPPGNVLIQIAVANHGETKLCAGLAGLLKTARMENPKVIGQLIEIEPGEEAPGVLAKLFENGRYPSDSRIRYQDGKRYIDGWSEVNTAREAVDIPWKDRGTYLITGGGGALGFIFAREIARQVQKANLILTGRSPFNAEIQAKIKELESYGARGEYRQVDVTQKKAVNDLVQNIKDEFGNLNGIIHGAGIIRDSYILKKTRQEFQEVLAPKVTGLVNLDHASKDLPLDLFIFFSSIAGARGNPGQADYSAANAFMDGYAEYRNNLVSLRQRQGRTLSMNWPLWEEGGMRLDEESQKMMRQNTGMIAMRTATGIQALYQSLASGKDRVLVMEGDIERIKTLYLGEPPVTGAAKAPLTVTKNKEIPTLEQDLIREKTTDYLKKLLASVAKLPAHRIEADAPLEKYGIDSIIAMQLTNQLEKTFGSLPKTLFFEYQNLQSLAGYFLQSYRGQLIDTLGMEEQAAPAAEISLDSIAAAEPVKPPAGRRRRRFAMVGMEPQPKKAPEVLDIAIIGVAGRYPGARNIEQFWNNLREGKDCITEIPKDRWDHSLYYDEAKNQPGKTYCKWGGFLEGVDQFDPLFFNISPREAETMDPMDRLFMETVWELLENAGYTREALQNRYQSRVGVYVGAMYQQYKSFRTDRAKESAIAISSYSLIANRVSHYFDFQGPSLAIDTMCSSAAVGIHLACESLMRGDCRLAIVGGVNLSIHPKKYVGLSQSQMIGSHINSRSFGDGDGYLPAEGVGAVLLKPLSEAIRDRDAILAVIKSTTTNHGGHTNGFAIPNPNVQAQLIEDNFIKSGIHPRTISYVEAAANGSALGDPIELSALNKVFQKFTPDKQFCAIGSVKSNIGHAEAASGMSQLTKVILQLQHGQLVPSIKAEPRNPNITFDNTPFYLQRELQEWKHPVAKIDGEEREYPRRAAVSSFGAGGSNAHLIIEEYIPAPEEIPPTHSETQLKLMVFSARNQDRLRALTRQMLDFVELQKELSLPDLAYTLQVGRESMEYRLAMVVSNREELVRGMKEYLQSDKEGPKVDTAIPVFTGDLEGDMSGLRSLLFGKLGENVQRELIAENNLEKIGLYWSQGGKIPWESVHQGERHRIISLPVYPFEKRRCWITPQLEAGTDMEQYRPFENATGFDDTTQTPLDNRIIDIVSRLLGMTAAELNIHKSLDQYGFDSILLMSLFQQLQSQIDPSLTLDKLQEFRTTQDIINILLSQNGAKTLQQATSFQRKDKSQISELIYLNQSNQGRPVFWIHPGLGGVEVYRKLAQKSARPFYGIQARGSASDEAPLHGIPAMAVYYAGIIRLVQPEGPYDLGGYSLGGAIAYEVVRQLQESGQTVATIVMLDSLDSNALKKFEDNDKSIILQTVNTALVSTIMQEPEKLAQTLIRREEVNLELENEAFMRQLIELAQKRGLTKNQAQIQALVQKNIEIQNAYQTGKFATLPLPDAQAINCYYFRNTSGVFFGDLDPYFSAIPGSTRLIDKTKYWMEWEQQFSNFQMMDVDASSHMMILTEPQSAGPILAFCEKLYSLDSQEVSGASSSGKAGSRMGGVSNPVTNLTPAGHDGMSKKRNPKRMEQKLSTYLFPGQGSQNKGMGGPLFDEFKELTAQAGAILGYSIKELCNEEPDLRLNETQYTQPALYVVNAFSYLKRIKETGKKPDFVAGHSLGEYNALLAAGAYDFETGLTLVKKRGELMSRVAGGGMAAVIGLSEAQIAETLAQNNLPRIDIANYNSPFQMVISGPRDEMEKAKSVLEGMKDVKMFVPLKTSGAFHSRYMEAAKTEFAAFLKAFHFSKLEIPVISNVKARPYQQSDLKQNLMDQITHPVKWTESIGYLMGLGEMEFEEIGPGRVLTGLVQRIKKESSSSGE